MTGNEFAHAALGRKLPRLSQTYRLASFYMSDLEDKAGCAPEIVHGGPGIVFTFALDDCTALISAAPPTGQKPDLITKALLILLPAEKSN